MNKIQQKLVQTYHQYQDDERYQDHFLWIKCGDYYEALYQHAERAAKVIGLTLMDINRDGQSPIPMVGVSYYRIEDAKKAMEDQGYDVLVVEGVDYD